jgi:hypothetical protein
MSLVSRELIEKARETEKLQQDDRMYFIDKALTFCGNNDLEGAKQALKRLKLMEDALVVYRLHKHEIDWNDTSCRVTVIQ